MDKKVFDYIELKIKELKGDHKLTTEKLIEITLRYYDSVKDESNQ
jgi:hypothetical protein